MSTQKITVQANKLWNILSASSTAETYGQTLALTGTIIRETALLIWLVLCLVLVLFDWLGTFAIAKGRQLRAWFDGLQEANTEQLATATWDNLLTTVRSSTASTIALARGQLGLPEKVEVSKPPAALASIQPATPPAPKTTPVSSEPVKPPTSPEKPADLPPATISDVE